MKYPLPFILLLLLVSSCGNNAPKSVKPATVTPVADSAKPADAETEPEPAGYPPGKPFFKCYVGTFHGDSIVLWLYSFGMIPATETEPSDYAGGSYYYMRAPGEEIGLGFGYRTKNYTRYYEIGGKNKWTLTINDSIVTGSWRDSTGKVTYDVVLREQYLQGSCRLEVVSRVDSSLVEGDSFTASMKTTLHLLRPVLADKAATAAVEREMLSAIDEQSQNKTKARTLQQYVDHVSRTYIREYEKEMNDNPPEIDFFANQHVSMTTSCLYNENDLLVLQMDWEEYLGGAHGNFSTTAICIDLRTRKHLTLRDLFGADPGRLIPLFEEKVQEELGDNYKEQLLHDEGVFVTPNFRISSAGIDFDYPPYSLVGFSAGPITISCSYQELDKYLSPAFKKRMGLK